MHDEAWERRLLCTVLTDRQAEDLVFGEKGLFRNRVFSSLERFRVGLLRRACHGTGMFWWIAGRACRCRTVGCGCLVHVGFLWCLTVFFG